MDVTGWWIAVLTDASWAGGRHDEGTVLVTQKGKDTDQHNDGMTKAGLLKWMFIAGDEKPDFAPKIHKLPVDLTGIDTYADLLGARRLTVKGAVERTQDARLPSPEEVIGDDL